MPLLLELADSEVLRVDAVPEGLCIRFAAAQVWRLPGSSRGKADAGYSRSVELVLGGAELPPDRCELIGRIAQGRLGLHGQWLARLPLPHVEDGPVQLELSFANRATLHAEAHRVECRFRGEPNFAESLAC